MTNQHLSALIAALCLFAGSQSTSATNYFNWGVETLKVDYGVNGPGQYQVTPEGATVQDCSVAHAGSCSSRLDVGPDSNDQPMGWDTILENPPYPWNYIGSPSLYYRWWMRIEEGFDWGSGERKTKSGRTKAADAITGGYTGYLYFNGFWIGECQQCSQDQYISYDFPADGEWHEYIVRIKANSSVNGTDAEFQAYVDGASVGSVTGFRLTQSVGSFHDLWGGWMVRPYFQLNDTSADGGTIYLDDFSVDDTYNSLIGPDADTTPPSAPTALSSVSVPPSQISLSWTASTDNVGVTGYELERCQGTGCGNFAQIASPTGTTYNDTGLSRDTSYTYRVRARDAAGNLSDYSANVTDTPGIATGSECSGDWRTLYPEWIWCDDFETDQIADYFESSDSFKRTAGIGLDDSYGMQADWTIGAQDAGSLKLAFGLTPSGGGFTQPAGVDSTTKFREIYYRVFLRSPTDWRGGGDASKFARLTSFVASDWSESMISHVWSSGTNNYYLGNDPVSCVSDGTVQCIGYNDFSHMTWLGGAAGTTAIFASPNVGEWNCVEGHVRLNDSGELNGLDEFWIDGHLEVSTRNLNFVDTYNGYGINALLLENYMNNGSPQAQSRYWDNLVVSTQRIGCALRSGDETTLPAPGDLRIIH